MDPPGDSSIRNMRPRRAVIRIAAAEEHVQKVAQNGADGWRMAPTSPKHGTKLDRQREYYDKAHGVRKIQKNQKYSKTQQDLELLGVPSSLWTGTYRSAPAPPEPDALPKSLTLSRNQNRFKPGISSDAFA